MYKRVELSKIELPKYSKKDCAGCGNRFTFLSRMPWQKYCTDACRKETLKNKKRQTLNKNIKLKWDRIFFTKTRYCLICKGRILSTKRRVYCGENCAIAKYSG